MGRDDRRDIGAEHHELAMSEIDDAHHAEDYGETDRGQEQEREAGLELIEGVKDAVGHGFLRYGGYQGDPITLTPSSYGSYWTASGFSGRLHPFSFESQSGLTASKVSSRMMLCSSSACTR